MSFRNPFPITMPAGRQIAALAANSFAVLSLALVAVPSVQAQTYDAAAQFSSVSNPNGVWSYGYTNTLGSAFTPFNTVVQSGTFTLWTSSAVNISNTPSFGKNFGPVQVGVQPGQVFLHPGPNNEFAVLRFTAPTAGAYTINSQFFAGDTGDTDAYIINNGTGTTLFSAATTNVNPSYSSPIINLALNGTIDFVVGSKGLYFNDTTPLNATVTAVPEPSEWVAMGMAGMSVCGLMIRARRRRTTPRGTTAAA